MSHWNRSGKTIFKMAGDQTITVSRDHCDYTLALLPRDFMTERRRVYNWF